MCFSNYGECMPVFVYDCFVSSILYIGLVWNAVVGCLRVMSRIWINNFSGGGVSVRGCLPLDVIPGCQSSPTQSRVVVKCFKICTDDVELYCHSAYSWFSLNSIICLVVGSWDRRIWCIFLAQSVKCRGIGKRIVRRGPIYIWGFLSAAEVQTRE